MAGEIIPVGGTFRSAVDEPVVVAAEVEASVDADQTLISGADAQAVLNSIIAHLVNLSVRAGGTPGISSVTSDASLSGDGTAGTPLAVANPFTAADETKLDAVPEPSSIVQWLTALPTASIANGDTIVVNGRLYRANVIAGGTPIAINMEQGHDPGAGEDDTGYRRGKYGSVSIGGQPVRWLDELYSEDEDNNLILRFRSATDPGPMSVTIQARGTYSFNEAQARTAYTIATEHGHQYESNTFAINPFARSGATVVTIRATNAITTWELVHADDIADWAETGSELLLPANKLPSTAVTLAQITGIKGVITATADADGNITIASASGAILPDALAGTDKTPGNLVTWAADGVSFGSSAAQLDAVVQTDDSLSGDGSHGSVLRVATPYTQIEQAKLGTVESGAQVNPDAETVKQLYESNTNTNVFTDAEKTALAASVAGAQTEAQVIATVQSELATYGQPFTAADNTKLEGIEDNATADQTAAEIKTAYESNADTEVFTTAEKSKLASVEDNAKDNMTDAEIKTAYENNANTNAFTDALKTKLEGVDESASADGLTEAETDARVQFGLTNYGNPFTNADMNKLDGIEANATADQTASEIKTAYESNADTNAFTDALKTKLDGVADSATAGAVSDDTLSGAGLTGDPLTVEVIKGYATFALLEAAPSPVAGHMAVVHGDTPARNGLYYRTNTLWEKMAELEANTNDDTEAVVRRYTGQLVDTGDFAADRLPLATSSTQGAITGRQYVVIENAIHSDDLHSTPQIANEHIASDDAVLIDDASVSSGSELREITFGELDKRWQAFDANLTIIGRAYLSGGIRPWPDNDVQIAGPVVQTPVPTIVPGTGITWGNTASRAGGVRLQPAYFFMRIAKSSRTTAPTAAPAEVRISRGGDETPVALASFTAAAETATHWQFIVSIADWPAGAETLTLERHEAAVLRILPADDSITVSKLRGLSEAGVGNLIGIGADGVFRAERTGGFRQVYSGSSGVSPVSLSANSGILAYEFDTVVDLDVDDGVLLTDDHLRIVTGPVGLSFSSTSVVDTINARGQASLQQIGFEGVYNGNSEIGIIAIEVPLYIGSTRVGAVVRRYSRNAAKVVAGNVRYDYSTGHSNISAASISDQSRTYLLSTSAPLLPRGAVGHVYSYADDLPEAEGYQDGDLVIVGSGDDIGVWRKDSVSTAAPADTGWTGKMFDLAPQGNLQPVDVTVGARTFRHWRYAPSSYTDPRDPTGTITAGGVAITVADLAYADLSYDTNGNIDGQIDIGYRTAQAYTGNLEWHTTGSVQYSFLISRVNATTWRATGISPSSISHLLAGQVAGSEPDHVAYTVVHSWTKVAGLTLDGMASLLTAGTDTEQRTWSAKSLKDELGGSSGGASVSAGTDVLLAAGTDTVQRSWSAKQLQDEFEDAPPALGTAALLDAGTDTVQRTWSAKMLEDEFGGSTGGSPGSAPARGTKALLDAGTDTVQRTWTAEVLGTAIDAATPAIGTKADLDAGTDAVGKSWSASILAAQFAAAGGGGSSVVLPYYDAVADLPTASASVPSGSVAVVGSSGAESGVYYKRGKDAVNGSAVLTAVRSGGVATGRSGFWSPRRTAAGYTAGGVLTNQEFSKLTMLVNNTGNYAQWWVAWDGMPTTGTIYSRFTISRGFAYESHGTPGTDAALGGLFVFFHIPLFTFDPFAWLPITVEMFTESTRLAANKINLDTRDISTTSLAHAWVKA